MLGQSLRLVIMSLVVSGVVVFGVSGMLRQADPMGVVTGPPEQGSHEAAGQEQDGVVGERELVVKKGLSGGHWVTAGVNGTSIRFLIDSGSPFVSLNPADARRAGLKLDDTDFTEEAKTSKGVMRMAPVTLDEVRIGPIVVTDVEAIVFDRPYPISFLGKSFLELLDGYEKRKGNIVLRY